MFLHKLSYYYEIAMSQGIPLSDELPTTIAYDPVTETFKSWPDVFTYGEVYDKSYRIASKVPIAKLYQHFEIARRLGIDKLEELLQIVKQYHSNLSEEEVKYMDKYTPISHMHELLTELESRIDEEIKRVKPVISKKNSAKSRKLFDVILD